MIKQFIEAHKNLAKVIIGRLKTAKTFKDKLAVIISVFMMYGKAIKSLLKRFILNFNKDYRKQRQDFLKQKKLKNDLLRALRLLEYLDKKMDIKGYNRNQRRQFWRDFSKNSQLRTEIFNELMNEIEAWK